MKTTIETGSRELPYTKLDLNITVDEIKDFVQKHILSSNNNPISITWKSFLFLVAKNGFKSISLRFVVAIKCRDFTTLSVNFPEIPIKDFIGNYLTTVDKEEINITSVYAKSEKDVEHPDITFIDIDIYSRVCELPSKTRFSKPYPKF